ncbi:mutator type transposase [Tanacetum coccineum]
MEAPIVVECAEDLFKKLDDILGEYAHIREQITGNESTRNESTRNEITGKQMVVHVGNSSTVDDVLELDMLFETEGVGLVGKFKEVEVDANNESEEENPKHDTSIGGVDVQDDDLDVIDYDSFGSDLDDGIDSEKRMQLRGLRRIGKQKNKGPNKYYFYLEQQFASTISALVPYVATDNNTDKNIFSKTKGGSAIRENINSGKQNILGKDKTVEGKGKKMGNHVIKSLAINPDIPVRAVQDQMQIFFKYSLLKEYAQELINQNPGTTVRIDVQQEPNPESLTRTFKRVYVCLGALKQGFRACGREILGLDGCFMSGPWPGQILTTVEVDANNGIYPVAYAIVEAESKASWCWFLNLLGEDLGIEANFNYTYISDRQKGLIQATASVFPSAEHRYCVRHIHENMKSQFKGGVYKEMLWNAAKATSEGEFKKKMGELKSFNSDAYDWLMKISLEQWSRAYFSGRAKCDILINNICEVFNRQLVDGRDQPIITCLEYIREYLMKRIVVVQKVIAKTVGPLTPSVTKMFDAIKKRLLSTMKWELTGIPCKHVVAAIYNMSENSVGVGIPEQWVHAAYRLETWAHVYSFKVNPCNGRDMWPVVESRTVIIPPLYKPPIGRPPKKRKKSNDEIASQSASSGKLSRKGKSVSCGKCGNVGHNRKGCRGQGGGSSQAGATNVSGQAAGARMVSGQAAGAKKVSGQAADARKASSQPSAAQSTAKQGPRQGFQRPIAGPAFGSQRKTKKLVDL